jgi:subtilase family serine protease
MGVAAARRARTRLALLVLAFASLTGTAMLAVGCGGGSSGRAVTSRGTTTAAAGTSTGQSVSKNSPFKRALVFAQCVRSHGARNFPGPAGKGGSVQETISPRSGVGPNSPRLAAARNACTHLLPNTPSGSGEGSSATASATISQPGPGALATDCRTLRTSPCYTPMQLRVAYGIQPLLDRGTTGRGQTVVLLEFPPSTGSPPASSGAQVAASSDVRKDLARFDGLFGLPAAKLQVVNTLAHVASPWLAAGEEVGDTEIVHALAPGAAIREVLIPSPYTASIGKVSPAIVAALRLGLAQGGVIELSAGAGEQCFTPAEVAQWNSALQAAQRDRVTVVISTGDNGAGISPCPGRTTSVKGVDLPASDPLTLAVGGTSLRASRATGAYIGETAWNTPPVGAGGGGFSRLFPRPAYQDELAHTRATRGVPDVAADADYRPGMAVAFSGGGHNYLWGGGGVSVAAPLWAAVIALADQYAGRHLGFVNPALYRIGRSTHYHQAFHDVTTGTNTVNYAAQTISGYPAAPGWDPVTGWGSPNAQALVPLLTRYVTP